jgi:crotonobetainyl-CoA:carnitine CoA-transferase CaiB-like acyl-CoA transferase
VIYLSITAFGESGPRANEPGMDILAQALSGVMALTGEADRSPAKCGASIADWTASFLGAFAVCAALRARDRDGVGQKLSVNLLDGMLASLPQFVGSYFATGKSPVRSGSGHPSVVPYQAFATSDGYIIVACISDRFWPRLCAAISRPDLAEDPHYSQNLERVKRRGEVVGIVEDALRAATTAYWTETFGKLDFPCSPVLELGQAVEDPQVVHNEMVITLDHPRIGPYRVVNNPIRMSRTPPKPRGFSPGVGEHTNEVLCELGYSDADLAQLRETRVIE